MSTLLEGILIVRPSEAVQGFAPTHVGSAFLRTVSVGPTATIVIATNPRSEGSHEGEIRPLAIHASAVFGRSLLIIYNDQTGDRRSEVYANGSAVSSFGPGDELYVPLKENGYPDLDHSPIRLGSLDPDDEYETIVNAIQLGARQLGVADVWDRIRLIAASS